MKRKYAKVAVALAATVTITAPGVGVPGNSGTVMAAEQTGNVQELNSITESQKEIVTGSSDIDNEAPVVTSTSVSPENSQVYYGAKTFTFETSEPIQSPGEGWTDVSDKKVLWSSFFVTLVAKKYRLATMLPFVPRMVCDSR